MKRMLFASLLALAGLALHQGTASAYCFWFYKPCIRIPLPRVPIVLPKITFPCADCCNQCELAAARPVPWYNQFPGAGPGAGMPASNPFGVPGAPNWGTISPLPYQSNISPFPGGGPAASYPAMTYHQPVHYPAHPYQASAFAPPSYWQGR